MKIKRNTRNTKNFKETMASSSYIPQMYFQELENCNGNTIINGTITAVQSVYSEIQCATWCTAMMLCRAFVYHISSSGTRTCNLKTYTGLLVSCLDVRLTQSDGAKIYITGNNSFFHMNSKQLFLLRYSKNFLNSLVSLYPSVLETREILFCWTL